MQQYYIEEKEISRFLSALKTDFELLECVDSTNDYLKAEIKSGKLSRPKAVVAIEQTKGRGTKGRSWISDRDSCLKISLAVPVKAEIKSNVAVSPALTLELCQRLNQRGYADVQLKWPNDLIRNEGKLAGVLLETVKHKEQDFLVIGVGINLFPNEALEQKIDRKIAFLLEEPPKAKDLVHIRTEIAKLLAVRCIGAASNINASGKIENYKHWTEFDSLRGKKIKVILDSATQIEGLDLGIDEKGHLLVQTESGEVKNVQIGEIEV